MAVRDFADLEISIARRGAESYFLDMRYTPPDSDTDNRLAAGETVNFSSEELQSHILDPQAYGKALSAMLFEQAAVREGFLQARANAGAVPLRLRLFIESTAAELHSLRWETLSDPLDGTPLLRGENLLFSRYLSSGDWRPVQLRSQSQLRALVVVAGPNNLSKFNLADVDVQAEVERARTALGAITIDVQAGPGQATLDAMMGRLRDGYDILYLVAHGALVRGKPVLYLENPEGAVAPTFGEEMVLQLRDLRERPRLIVLASCESAGQAQPVTADGTPLAAIGPRLAEAGIPAVLAMQGQVSMETIGIFTPAFFAALQKHGEIDRAMAVARTAISRQIDHWMPVLFMRLRSGRIWYTPGFADEKDFEKWPALVASISSHNCTPIIGPYLNESLLGSPRDLAMNWAEEFDYPLAGHERDDLPQVSQYLAVKQDRNLTQTRYIDEIRKRLLKNFGPQLPGNAEQMQLNPLFAAIAGLRYQQPSPDSYKILANMPFPVYVTACTDRLLVEALKLANKDPVIEYCRWNEDLAQKPASPKLQDPEYKPSPEQPLVFHLFGLTSVRESLVLTEDDYFDYLIGVSLNKQLIPPLVRAALVDRALLFLGFRLEDWSFRVLFRSLMNKEGQQRLGRYTSVAGQFVPEDGMFLYPDQARKHLQDYFTKSSISIFWGSVDDFIQQLQAAWEQHAPAVQVSVEEDPFA